MFEYRFSLTKQSFIEFFDASHCFRSFPETFEIYLHLLSTMLYSHTTISLIQFYQSVVMLGIFWCILLIVIV